jgi:hypothetical protein
MAESEGVKNPLGSIPKEKRMYVYLGVGAAGIVAYAWWRNSQTPSDASEAAMDSAYSDDGYVTQATPGDFWAGGSGGGSGSSSDSGSDGYSGMPLLKTNADWTQYATETLSAAGTDPTAVQSALGKYLDRKGLTTAEQDYVRRALAAAGPPPVGTYQVIPGMDSVTAGQMAAPANLRSRQPATASTVFLQWDRVAGASTYRVYRSGVSQNVSGAGGLTADIGGLQPNTPYTFTVRGVDNQGASGPASNSVTVKTASPKVGTPSTPKASQVTKTSVYLTWGKVAGATRYRVFREGTAGSIGDTASTNFRVANLTPGKRFRFRVAAMNGSTQGPNSGYVTVTTKK